MARTSPDGRLEIREFEIQDLRKRDSRFEIFEIVRDWDSRKDRTWATPRARSIQKGGDHQAQKHGVDTRSRRPTVCLRIGGSRSTIEPKSRCQALCLCLSH